VIDGLREAELLALGELHLLGRRLEAGAGIGGQDGGIERRLRGDVDALEAIERADGTEGPALTPAVLTAYASTEFVPTVKKVKLAESEKQCLAQAIYHEARGESREGQLAVANVIINRAFSKKYPSSICGVVYQNADKGRYKCQFTFACDGRPDEARERAAWKRSLKMAEDAFYEYQKGARPGVVPDSVLYYHTTAVAPRWSRTFRRVAAIGSHVFYTPN